MKQKDVILSFLDCKKAKSYSLESNGFELRLHGNVIARKHLSEIEISTAGFNTRTTLKYLRLIPFVSVYMREGNLYLNGCIWDGRFVKV
jgi:hypothetical protein